MIDIFYERIISLLEIIKINSFPCSSLLSFSRISTESHSPKLQIRSHSYLRAVSEVSINRSLDSLDPVGLLSSPKFRSRNESYMRAMSTISQVCPPSLSLGVKNTDLRPQLGLIICLFEKDDPRLVLKFVIHHI